MSNQEVKELSLHQKLVIMQTELKVPKNIWNKFSEFYYRNAEGIIEAAKPYLEKYGLTLTCNDDIKNIGNWNYVVATYTLSDGTNSFTASASAREQETKKGMDASQITGSTSSYARKYALNALFALDDVKDADDDKPVEETPQEAPKPKFDRAGHLKNAQAYIANPNGLKLLEALGIEKDFEKVSKFTDEQLKGWINTIRQNAKAK